MTKPKSKIPRSLRLEWRTPAELTDNPENWRTHPTAQTEGLAAVIGQVGWAGAALYNERTKRLIDGHARKHLPDELLVDGKMPVLVGNWTEEQERMILLTLDPLAALAEADNDILGKLLLASQSEDAAVQALFDGLAEENVIDIFADGEELPNINETTRHTVVVPYNDGDIPILQKFLEVDELPDRLGKAIIERIKAIAAA
jgi:hypothetical protein